MRDAIRLCERGQLGEALAHLIALWPTHRDAELAALIDQLGAFLDRSVKDLPQTRQHAHWMERFADRQPADLTMLARLAVEGSTSKQCALRIAALAELPPDPRCTTELLRFMETCGGEGVWGKVWTASLKVLRHGEDPRVPAGLTAIAERFAAHDLEVAFRAHRFQIERIERFTTKFPEPDPRVDCTDLRRCVEILVAGPAPELHAVYVQRRNVRDDIHDQILIDPEDDGPIQVWADLLMESDDDLGEFVTLQLKAAAGRLTKTQLAKERRLRKAHVNRLLGPLAPCVDPASAVFRRGLLYGAKVTFRTDDHHSELGQLPHWRSVVQVQTSAKHLRSGALPSARRFGCRLIPTTAAYLGAPLGFEYQQVAPPGWNHFRDLARSRTALPLRAVCVSIPTSPLTAAKVSQLDDPRGLPDLEELHIVDTRGYRPGGTVPELLGALDEGSLLRRLRRLVFDSTHTRMDRQRLGELWERYRPDGGELVVLGYGHWCWTVRSDDEGLHLHGSSASGDFHAVQEACTVPPGDWATVVLRGPTMHEKPLGSLREHFGDGDHVVLPKQKR